MNMASNHRRLPNGHVRNRQSATQPPKDIKFDTIERNTSTAWQRYVLLTSHAFVYLFAQVYNVHRTRVMDMNLMGIGAIVAVLLRGVVTAPAQEGLELLAPGNGEFSPRSTSSINKKPLKATSNVFISATPLQFCVLIFLIYALSSTAWKLPFWTRVTLLSLMMVYAWTSLWLRKRINYHLLQIEELKNSSSISSTALSGPQKSTDNKLSKASSAASASGSHGNPPAPKSFVDGLLSLSKGTRDQCLTKLSWDAWTVLVNKLVLILLEATFTSFVVSSLPLWTLRHEHFYFDRIPCIVLHMYSFLGSLMILWVSEITDNAEVISQLAGMLGCWHPVAQVPKAPLRVEVPLWDRQLGVCMEGRLVQYGGQIFVSVGKMNASCPSQLLGSIFMVMHHEPLLVHNWTVGVQCSITLSLMAFIALSRSWKGYVIAALSTFQIFYLCIEARKRCRSLLDEGQKSHEEPLKW